jgi:hypothetical protein
MPKVASIEIKLNFPVCLSAKFEWTILNEFTCGKFGKTRHERMWNFLPLQKSQVFYHLRKLENKILHNKRFFISLHNYSAGAVLYKTHSSFVKLVCVINRG